MKTLFAKFLTFCKIRDGATAIEYSLIAAGIALAIVVIVFIVGDDLVALFTDVQQAVAQGG